MRVFDLLKIGAESFPENPAVIHNEKRIDYETLQAAVAAVAARIESFGLKEGSRIAILCENSIEYLIFYFAIFKSGYVAVPLDTSLKPEKIGNLIIDCAARALLFHGKYRRHFDKIIDDKSPVKYIISNKDLKLQKPGIEFDSLDSILENNETQPGRRSPEKLNREIDADQLLKKATECPDDLAAIFYTSGSTGDSKGVMLSHRNLVSNTIATVKYLKLRSHDKIMVILPFYYIYGNSLLLTHVLCGGTLIIDNRFLYPEVILDTMEKERATGFSGVPSNFIILLGKSTLPERKCKDLRYFTQAGGSMAPEIIKKLMQAFPDKEIYIMYGQTEASPRVSYLPPERLEEKLGSIGIPVPEVTIKVVDESGKELPVGESGELAVEGDNVMLGYWNQPEDTAEVIKDGWLYTGDLARMDADGYFYITGRKKEIIKTGGNRVSAKEIEECILEHEAVLEVAVIGIPDDLLGEKVKAYVVLKDGYQAASKELRAFCKIKLAEHKIPRIFEFADSLPKYQSGKVNKPLLKSMS